MDRLLKRYPSVLEEAAALIQAREDRNRFLSLENMFPHGPQDLTFVVWMKAARILGLEAAGRLKEVREEALDVLNYAAFLVGLIDLRSGGQG